MRVRSVLCLSLALGVLAIPAIAYDKDKDKDDDDDNNNSSLCNGLPTATQLKAFLKAAPAPNHNPDAGGLFHGDRMWGAIVNRDGEICAVTTNQDDPAQVWPGSQAIAKAKAYTANAFSLDTAPLSTARLYTLTQPGHSLWSLGQSNLFDPAQLGKTGRGNIAGGLIFFGGGVALYRNGKVIGGLGISGDTSCADHEIAKRVRTAAGLNPTGGPAADDIVYTSVDPVADRVFAHPLCPNTFRNGIFIGNEPGATTY